MGAQSAGLFATKWIKCDWRERYSGKLSLLIWVFLAWQPIFFLAKYPAGQTLPEQEKATLLAHLLRMLAAPSTPSGETWFLWALAIYFALAKLLVRIPAWIQLVLGAILAVVWNDVLRPSLPESLLALI